MDIEKARQQLAERQKRQKEEGRGRTFYTLPKQGRAVVRYLPQPDGGLGVVTGAHFNIPGVDRGLAQCLKEHWGNPCPIHQVCANFEKFIDLKEYLVNAQGYAAVLVLEDSENPQAVNPKVPKIMRQSSFGYETILSWVLDKSVNDITDPRTGCAVTYSREKKSDKWDRKYNRGSFPIAATEEEIQEILKKVPDLSKVIKPPTDKEIETCKKGAEALYDLLMKKMGEAKTQDAAKFSPPPAQPVKAPEQEKPVAEVPKPVEAAKPPEPVKPVEVTQPVQEVAKASEVPPVAPTVSKPGVEKPKGAPECFGNKVVHDAPENAKKCLCCMNEFHCQLAIKQA
jgi:hypothetical protein